MAGRVRFARQFKMLGQKAWALISSLNRQASPKSPKNSPVFDEDSMKDSRNHFRLPSKSATLFAGWDG